MNASPFSAKPSLLSPTQGATSYLFCVLNDKTYAMNALAVREVLPLPEVTRLNETPSYLSGFIYLRGQFVPVVDLSDCLKLPSLLPDSGNALVVLEHNGSLAGVAVNEVRDVGNIALTDITPVSPASGELSNSFNNCIFGIARTGEENVQLLNLEGIFALTAAYSQGGILDYTATQYGEKNTENQRNQVLQVAVVQMYGELFGIEVNWIREFAPLRTITPVPSSPDSVVGLMNLRGEILTIIDISKSLHLVGSPEKLRENQVVVVEYEDWKVGILVDDVLDIFGLPPYEFDNSDASDTNEALRGTTWFHEKIMGVLDVPKLLQQERRMLEEQF